MLFNNRFDYMATPKALAQLEKTNVFVDSLKQRDNVQEVAWNNVTYEEHLGDGRYCSLFHVKVKQRSGSSKQRRSKSSRSGRKVDDDDESNCCLLDYEKTKQYIQKNEQTEFIEMSRREDETERICFCCNGSTI